MGQAADRGAGDRVTVGEDMKLGSLFDGSGGFPLAGTMCGITPAWASEIEPYPIAVTKARFPNMKHLGDITKIDGAKIEPVDVVTFGSPCQDLSVAGKQKGLAGERSGLFLEAIRIIKEMRTATNGKYPTFIIWENVPGAYSSNKGEDFRTVLQEVANVASGEHVIPRPPNGWAGAGAVMGGGFSIAWRTLDAQYWGVPQRRKRIFLVADFRGGRAGKILFERDGLRRGFKTGKEAGEEVAEDIGKCIEEAGFDIQQITSKENRSSIEVGAPQPTLCRNGRPGVITSGFRNHTICAGFKGGQGTGQIGWQEECAATLGANMSHNEPTICIATQQGGAEIANNLCPTITAAAGMSGNNQPCICIAGNTTERHAVCAIDCRNHCANEISGTLQAKPNGGQSLNYQNPVMTFGYQSFGEYKNADVSKTLMASGDITTSDLVATYAIRRLTPLECCRLQGFPDWWMDGINGSDSAKYKMWGNGIALPCALYVMEGIAELREGKSNE